MQPNFDAIAENAFDALDLSTVSKGEAARLLKAAYVTAQAKLAEEYTAAPLKTRAYIHALSKLTDGAVQIVFDCAARSAGFEEDASLAVLAVGGCGRAEMAPYSDVDLLFLCADNAPPTLNAVIEACLYMFWDMKLKVGHATRTISEALQMAKSDITIRTSVLENRHLLGDVNLTETLNRELRHQLFSRTAPEFVEQKLFERDDRHKRHGGARYVLEPNVKEGKGGLRDLQTLFWITKYVSGSDAPHEMVAKGYFTQEEMAAFIEAETFLWTVRCHLHLNARRALEKLTFDHQIDLAKRLNYADSSGQRGVERFMQDFFRHATTVGDLTRIFLTALEAEHVKPRPTFKQRVVNLFGVRSNEPAPEGYQIENGRLNVSDPERFLDDPINILRIFEEALHSEVLIHPNTMRVIAANLNLITDQVRSDETAQTLFLGLLLDHGNPERALRRMNELGVLGQFIPEFERIIAMMQFNFYHHFTVDEHTIQCVAYLAKLESGQLSDTFPIVSRILKKGLNRRILYVALLVHDIGKGLPTAHEVIGEEMARDIAPRLSLDEEETETVAWLVRNHLEMSDMAQKRDISDPKTVRDFARSVQSIRRLNLLTALTVCDILGVGPGTLTPWKAELLRQLYTATRHFLREGSVDGAVEESVSAKQSALAALLENWEPKAKDHELSRHYAEYWMGLDTATQFQIAEGLRRVTPSEIEVSTAKDEQREATRICFVLQDHPGIFSRLAGALGLAGMNVIEARTYTTSDGYATAVFWIHNQIGQVIEDEARLNRLKETFKKTLSGEVIARRAIVEKDKIAKRERDMLVSTEITFDNEGSDVFTIIEVDTRDRPGLLYDLTRTLADSNIRISSASVTTYGAQAVDTFYVKDIFGLKIQSSQKQATVAAKLEAAIHAGAERALAQ